MIRFLSKRIIFIFFILLSFIHLASAQKKSKEDSVKTSTAPVQYALPPDGGGGTIPEPDAPPTPSVSSNYCGYKTLTRVGTPPSGVAWAWQTTSRGTNVANMGSTYTAKSTGTYYLRPVKVSSNTWGPPSSVYATVNYVGAPAPPTVQVYGCSHAILTRSTPPSGITWYWQGTSSGGTSTVNASSTYTAYSSGTYYIRGKNNTTGCWGSSRSITVTLANPPAPPPTPSVSYNYPVMYLTRQDPPSNSNLTYYWKDDTGTLLGTQKTLEGDPSRTYFLVAKSNITQCWSSAVATSLNPGDIPPAPTGLTVSENTCGNRELSIPLPPGSEFYVYYWQGTNEYGQSENQGGGTYTVTSTGQYFIRAKHKTKDIWGAPVGIAVEFVAVPADPIPVNRKQIGKGYTTFTATGGTGTYYWYNAPGGGNPITIEPVKEIELLIENTTVKYASAYNASGCYSNRIPVTITVYPFPQIQAVGSDKMNIQQSWVDLTANEDYDSYKWYRNGYAISGANQKTYTTRKTGFFQVEITKNGVPGKVKSDHFKVEHLLQAKNHTYSVVTDIKVEGVKNKEEIDFLDPAVKQLYTTYYDHYGRKEQELILGASPSGKDIIQGYKYDQYGRQSRSYLPYTKEGGTAEFRVDWENEIKSFYQPYNDFNGDWANFPGSNSDYPYSEVEYEDSPLGRATSTGSPGAYWRLAGDHTVNYDYLLNDGSENIIEWKIDEVTLLPVNSGTYSPGLLSVSTMTDEKGITSKTYTDVKGNTVLSRQASETETYSVYDQRGRPCFVLQPALVARLKVSGANPTQQQIDNLAFYYKYDERDRLIASKKPGADWEYMIYDERDRLVLSQDGNQRQNNKFSFVKYDMLNRPVMTGEMVINNSVANLRDLLDGPDWLQNYAAYETSGGDKFGYTSNSLPKNLSLDEIYTVTYYDNYDFPHASDYSFVPELENSTPFDRVKGLVTGSKVKVLGKNSTWLESVDYYDHRYRTIQHQASNVLGGVDRVTYKYDFAGKVLETRAEHSKEIFKVIWKDLSGVSAVGSKLTKVAGGNNWDTGGAASENVLVAGEDGWAEMIALETNTFRMFGLSPSNTNSHYSTIGYAMYPRKGGGLYIYENGTSRGQKGTYVSGDRLKIERVGTTVYYKKNDQVIFTSTILSSSDLLVDVSLYTMGATIFKAQTSFGPRESRRTYAVNRTLEYDRVGRLVDTWHQIDGGENILLRHNEYNELGQLIEKGLHQKSGTGKFTQSIDYRYNIRGGLTSINDASLDGTLAHNPDQPEEQDYFGMNIGYYQDIGLNIPPADLQYNGNISAIQWSNGVGDNASTIGYGYSYDDLNRIKNAQSYKTTTNAFNLSQITYDLNGNIEKLDRSNSSGVGMDELTYNYGAESSQGNQILAVSDASTPAEIEEGFHDGNTTGNDYEYDMNGNMTVDRNKDIAEITYNYLNVPEKILFSQGHYISYIYSAAGRKLAQETYNATGDLLKHVDYAGPYIYENDTLKMIQHEEGRIIPGEVTGDWEYQYYMTDHQGNTRVTFTTKPKTWNFTLNYEGTGDDDASLFSDITVADNDIFDHTDAAGTVYTKSQMLSGAEGSRIGSAIAIPVGMGDIISVAAFAKYVAVEGSPNDVATSLAAALISAFTSGVTANGEFGSTTINNNFSTGSLIGGAGFPIENDAAPHAFLNLMFLPDGQAINLEKDVTFAYDQIDINATQLVGEMKNTNYDEMNIDGFVAPAHGYVLVYLSNESSTLTEVHYDDLSIEVNEHPVIQRNDYYPFGLQHATSWTRTLNLKTGTSTMAVLHGTTVLATMKRPSGIMTLPWAGSTA